MIETQVENRERLDMQTYEQSEISSSWYDLTLKIIAAVALAIALIASLWPEIMRKL
jgi:hypothetical protein